MNNKMNQYNKLTENIAARLMAVCPCKTGEEISPDYARDEMPIYGTSMPDLVAKPRSTREVSDIMKICWENRIPVTPRGAGTGLVGGAVPLFSGVVLDLSSMNRIIGYDTENFVAKVEAGVILKNFAEDALSRGLLYPPDPGEKYATLGGNVSTNAGGMRAVKYGTTRDYVRAMTVVLADGEIIELGATVSKTSSGYSLMNLMIGSEGTLGIITELTLKLIPAPAFSLSLIVPFESLEPALKAVPRFKMAGLEPQAIEFMESEIVRISQRYIGRSVFPSAVGGKSAGAYLLITLDAKSSQLLDDMLDRAAQLCMESGALEVFVADTPSQISTAWAARSSFLDAVMEETKLLDECDVVVPVNRIAEYLSFVNTTGRELGLDIKSFGHAGDGNLHIYQCSNDMTEAEFKSRVDKFFEIIYARASEMGGMVSGEHGIGSGKVSFLAASCGERSMELMKNIKKVFDPRLILNPGKVVGRLEI